MSETESGARITAGGMLRAARERQGLHIAALAAAIKVAPRKLDALEHDRYHELPDATFTRALAQTVCRTLKIEARPVLALLPQPDLASLENVAGSLNTPFRERSGREDSGLAVSAIRPLVWASGALMLAALVLHFLPDRFWESLAPASAPIAVPAAAVAPASAAASDPVPSSAALAGVEAPVAVMAAPPAVSASAAPLAAAAATVAVPVPPQAAAPAPAPAPPAATAPAALVQIRTTDASWIEVQDARGQMLLSRIVQAGESVGLDGALPMRLKIGNASATQLGFRGQPVDLTALARDNVARLELK